MEATTEKIDLRNIDKSDWQTFRFDKIAQKISERVDPNETDLDTYIGLTHIDGEDIHIRRTGSSDDVKGTKLRFYPGDVIFGRRRAYLRKAAVAKTHGFCSAHALVLRANPDVIDPKLFPFFLHSDQFMHRAVDISVGSLSPTINWGKLKIQDFRVPPKQKQIHFKDLISRIDEVCNSARVLNGRGETFFRSKLKAIVLGSLFDKEYEANNLMNTEDIPKDWEVFRLKKLFERIKTKNKGEKSENVLTISAKDGLVNQEKYFNRKVSSKNLDNYYLLNKYDFAFNKSYSDGYPAGAIKVLENYDLGVVSPLYICFRSKLSEEYTHYYKYLFESGFLNGQILSVAKEGARNHGLLNVSTKDFFNLKVPKPPIGEIKKILELISKLNSNMTLQNENLESTKKLQKSIINEIF